MTPIQITAVVDAMHAAYCEALGAAMPLTFGRRTQWERLVVDGYTADDLMAVLTRWKRQIRNGMNVGVLRFSRITDSETFGDDLMLAKAEQKLLHPATPKDKALRDLRPQACEQANTQAAQRGRDVALRALDKLRKDIGSN